jgi:hypothetical protein
MEKVKKYKKSNLRKTLELRMQEYWGDSKIKVTPMEFSRMLKTYCEEFGLPDEIRRAKELEEPLVDAFGSWLGYPLREVSTGLKGKRVHKGKLLRSNRASAKKTRQHGLTPCI